ncbi:MAG TPA: molybdenum cofactor biosynthesis protein MoaE [Hyphomicrobiales bacterium]|nr:molybdenum cofactor biosynthesis protein MoaE [Hyphomicrobiales bacterium]
MSVRIQREDFDIAAEAAQITGGAEDVGAVVTFTGICRSDGGRLAALELEHYPGMAEAEMSRIVDEAKTRWPLSGVRVIHRYGRLEPGDNIVLVITASSHRGDAFAAAEFLMDYLKTRAPFWKKEHLADRAGNWVEAAERDDARAERWSAAGDGR